MSRALGKYPGRRSPGHRYGHGTVTNDLLSEMPCVPCELGDSAHHDPALRPPASRRLAHCSTRRSSGTRCPLWRSSGTPCCVWWSRGPAASERGAVGESGVVGAVGHARHNDGEAAVDDDLDVARLVMRVRRMADLSQRDLAARLGTSPSTVARIETGGCAVSVSLLGRILRLAGLRL